MSDDIKKTHQSITDVSMQEINQEMDRIFRSAGELSPDDQIHQGLNDRVGRMLVGKQGKVIDIDFESCTHIGCNFTEKLHLIQTDKMFWTDLFEEQDNLKEIRAIDFDQVIAEQQHLEFNGVRITASSGMHLFTNFSIWVVEHEDEQFAVVLISDAKRKHFFEQMDELVLNDSVSDYARSLMWSFKDIFQEMDSTQMKALELLLFEIANIDILTDVPNRKMFLRILKESIEQSKQTGLLSGMGVGIVKVHNMHTVNTQYSYEHGDALLNKVATELKTVLRGSDFAARYSGTTFAFALPNVNNQDNMTIMANRVIKDLQAAEVISDDSPVKLSIGLTLLEDETDTVETLMNRAQEAAYQANNNHEKSAYEIF